MKEMKKKHLSAVNAGLELLNKTPEIISEMIYVGGNVAEEQIEHTRSNYHSNYKWFGKTKRWSWS